MPAKLARRSRRVTESASDGQASSKNACRKIHTLTRMALEALRLACYGPQGSSWSSW